VSIAVAQTTLTGKWQGETANGFEVVLDLNATDNSLTGKLTYNGQPSEISEGKVSKTSFTFRAMLQGQMEGFNGELAGNQITFWPDRLGRARAVILKRVKK
jgi:hypothetical protein